jgi:shikimate 5-dehydrogenase
MNASAKTILIAMILVILGLGGMARTVYANQSQPKITITERHRANNQNRTEAQEASDGDGEANDATEPPEQEIKKRQIQETDENEANEGLKDRDGGAKEDSQ